MQVFTKSASTICIPFAKKARVFFFAAMLCGMSYDGFATAWTTAVAGPVTTLSNWSDGASGVPTSFTTAGDTWTITMSMTLPSPGSWTLGSASTLTFATGGTLSISGAGSTTTITVPGTVVFSGGTYNLGGAGTTCNFTVGGHNMTSGSLSKGGSSTILNYIVNGTYTMSGGTVDIGGASGVANLNINGAYSMTGGTTIVNGASATLMLNVKGNFSMSGASAMTNTGASCTSTVHLMLPATIMLIDNTSTGAWSKTNVYVDTFCTAQLAGNFSNTTGTAAYGLTVNGTLMCPATMVVNGTGIFAVNGVATLVVAATLGINGNIASTGTLTFNPSANYHFNGSVAQMTGTYLPTSLISPSVLTINNSAGVTLTNSVSTGGTLAFTAGILNTGTNTMTTLGAPTAVTGAGLTSYVNGTLIKTITGYTTVNYEVGDATYAPMALALSAAGTSGSLGVKSTNGLHPSVASSGLTSSNMANHYWTISNYAAAGPATVDPMATYIASDIIGGSNAAFLTQEYVGSAWLGTPLATSNTSSPYTSSPNTGIALATVAGQYIFGNLFCGTLPITGTSVFCVGNTTTLSDATPGGTWSSATPGVATISSTGVVTGVSGGTATISYTVSGCTVTNVVTVMPLPSAGTITGPSAVCVGDTITLVDTVSGGVWSSVFTAKATVSATGMVIGIAAGMDTIVYTVTNSCGSSTAKKTISVLSATACAGGVGNTLTNIAELKVYPNPNNGTFTFNLSSPENEEVLITISDVVGRQVKELTTKTNSTTTIMLNQPAGIFIVSAATASNRYFVKVTVE